MYNKILNEFSFSLDIMNYKTSSKLTLNSVLLTHDIMLNLIQTLLIFEWGIIKIITTNKRL